MTTTQTHNIDFNIFNQYVKNLNDIIGTNDGTEMSYRSALEKLLKSLLPSNITIINEPKHSSYGIPDLKLYRNNDIVISFVETKLPGDTDLEGRKQHKEQFSRYKEALSVITFTDFSRFILYVDGVEVEEAKIIIQQGDKVGLTKDEHELSKFEHIISLLGNAKPQKITSPKRLSMIMAAKAKLLSSVVENATVKGLNEDNPSVEDINLVDKMKAFRKILVHDMDVVQFADFYAQTIVYGMFIARINDKTPESFSRLEAVELIPNGYPFLKEIFSIIAISNLHSKLKWIVDDLAELFKATNMEKVLKDYGSTTGRKDPVVHFYEDFLEAYNPKIRDQYGVWLTPLPVVRYIVKSVDTLLRKTFNLQYGLADNEKSDNEHIVQILDPAVGTGTFLAEATKVIHSYYEGNEGMWPEDVREHIIPRLMGFEYLMAPYTMAHLKIANALGLDKMQGAMPERLNIFLTNSLDKYNLVQTDAFAQQISLEANAANEIKSDGRVMVVLGNPPYNEKSANNSDWIMMQMDDYKQEPGMNQVIKTNKKGIKKSYNTLIGEKNSKALNNDYCKFIRLGQMFVDRTQQGILAYITANTYLDTKLFRGMRYNLLQSFDDIYIVNLHGATRRKAGEGENKDENVFNIEAGVAIAIFVKQKHHHSDDTLAKVYYKDLLGSRKFKFAYLLEHGIDTTDFEEVTPKAPYYIMRKRDTTLEEVYDNGFSIDELMTSKVQGFKSDHDSFAIHFNRDSVLNLCNDFVDESKSDDYLRSKYGIKDSRDWSLSKARTRLSTMINGQEKVLTVTYRPFDTRWTMFDKSIISYPRKLIVESIAKQQNIVLAVGQQGNVMGDVEWSLIFISTLPIDINVFPRGGAYLFPLHVYKKGKWMLNLNLPIVYKIAECTGLKYGKQLGEEHEEGLMSPVDIIDYIYAVLNSSKYHKLYHDFLQTAFPKIPYPVNKDYFLKMVVLGRKLRLLHTLRHVPKSKVTFPKAGDNIITERKVEDMGNGLVRIKINDTQCFENVPLSAWNLIVAGYKVADKWLELRQRDAYKLTNPDILHFEKMIAVLEETIAVKMQIDDLFT